jgi:septal ring factor EnvC (AmiA/AmiB activator)
VVVVLGRDGPSQLADLTVDPVTHAALRRDNDRLTSQNRSLQQELDAARRTSTQLERELAASRRAHAEHVAELAADPRVSALTGHGDS